MKPEPSPPAPDWLTCQDVADRWKCDPSTVRNAVRAGRLAAFRDGSLIRIDRAEVERYEQSRMTQPRITPAQTQDRRR